MRRRRTYYGDTYSSDAKQTHIHTVLFDFLHIHYHSNPPPRGGRWRAVLAVLASLLAFVSCTFTVLTYFR